MASCESKKLKVAIQMDNIDNINIASDSSYALLEGAERLEYDIYYYQPKDLHYSSGKVFANSWKINITPNSQKHYHKQQETTIDLKNDVDIILVRQDPPFDLAYQTSCHLLSLVGNDTLIVNNPVAIVNSPEKILPLSLCPEYMPATIISSDIGQIQDFHQKHQDIVIKPLYSFGGNGVVRITPDAQNLSSIVQMELELYNAPLIAQKFLPEIRQGDKRIILFDGEPVGAISRIPDEHDIRSNLCVGGSAQKTNLTKREYEICQKIAPYLRDNSLFFVGIDVIGDYLTEINSTSPTGIRAINQADHICLEDVFWEKLLKKYF